MFLTFALRGALAIFLAILWEGIRLLNGANGSWEAVGWRSAMAVVALCLGAWAASGRRRWVGSLALVLPFVLVACWLDLRQTDTRVAWSAIAGLYVILLALESAFVIATQKRDGRLAWLEYGVAVLLLAVIGGVAPATIAQIEAKFAEEEFFVAVQAAFLTLFSLLLLLAHILARRLDRYPDIERASLRPLWGILGLFLVGTGFVCWSVSSYRAGFYTPTAPLYDEVSAESPFLCASLPPAPGSPDGRQVFQRIQKLVEANPRKGVPEYGMLALITGDLRWADDFRQAILAEAGAARFTGPAGSVKYGQRLAALRAYYLPRIHDAFPDLFSGDELVALRDWFAAINRRAMTTEWVDLLYGLAFSVWPEGPYENQENGAGLLALLESADLQDDQLSALNRDYLARNVRGWDQRFRNTDDAYLYQTEWIDNAFFQDIYWESSPDPQAFERRRSLAFEWLLLQMLPGGAPLTYNRPGARPVINTLYLGALLLDDPRYVWAADQALTDLEVRGGYLYAQPGLEQAVEFTGAAPTQGTCLLYSPSGLPTQVGPLAPDKIVFRDGWTADATYLLLNLRFTGWHRYKGTNGIVLLNRDGPIVVEESVGQPFGWLPVGRSLFRDKRVPRENLNGLLIRRSGFSQAVFLLSGLGGPWAQDPPHHARVDRFDRLGVLDASRTTVDDWRGWQHQRAIYFFHQGPVIVIDNAHRPGGGQSALTWHLEGLGERTAEGLWLRRGDSAIRVALSDASWRTTTVEAGSSHDSAASWHLTYLAPDPGQLDLVTTFLMDRWAEADYSARAVQRAGALVGQYVDLSKGDEEIRLLHNLLWQAKDDAESSDVITAAGLSTDGPALVVFDDTSGRPGSVCTLGGSRAGLALTAEPRGLLLKESQTDSLRGQEWEWEAGMLTLWPSSAGSACWDIIY